MAVTAFWYVQAFKNAFDQTQALDWNSDVIKILLTTASYTPNQDTHSDHADINNEVASGGGYTTGGETLANKTSATSTNVYTIDNTNDADSTWETSTITARRAVIYDATPTASGDKPLIIWIDFGTNESSSAGDFAINMNAAGIGTVTPANASGFP
jgi:hypothetical protein